MKKTAFIVLFFLFLFFFPVALHGQSTPPPPQLVIDPSIDQSRIDLPMWLRTIWPLANQISTPGRPITKITFTMNGSASGDCITRTISLGGLYPTNKASISELAYRAATHELFHLFSPCPSSTSSNERVITDLGLEEGLAEAKTHRIYQALGFKEDTDLYSSDILNSLPRNAGAGAFFYSQFGFPYQASAGPLEHLASQSDFKKIDEARLGSADRRAFLAKLDALSGAERVSGGVLPSTFLDRTLSTFTAGPDGKFFAVYAYATIPNRRTGNGHTPINPQTFLFRYLKRETSPGDLPKGALQAGIVRYEATDFSGRVIASSLKQLVPPADMSVDGTNLTSSYPEGAYKLTTCVLTNGDCDPNPELRDTTFFLVYRREDWTRGQMFIIQNGPTFFALSSQTQLQLVNPPPGVFVQTLPGLLILTGVRGDVVLTDGQKTRTFTAHPELSTIHLWTPRHQPWLGSVTHAATFEVGPLVPGSIATAFTWGATPGDPVQSSSLPLPSSSCDDGTEVIFSTTDGRQLKGPLFYCSRNQINFQVPRDLPVGATVGVGVKSAEGISNALALPTADFNPGIFVVQVQWPKVGAVIRNSTGELITPANPAVPGEVLAIFATGLGPTDPPLPADGYPAPSLPLSRTTTSLTVTLNGSPVEVIYSGLAPGFVGLYQINIRVPEGMTSGELPLAIEMGVQTSNQVNLAVR